MANDLELRSAAFGGSDLRVFEDARRVRAHLRDHILTSPESELWSRVWAVSGVCYEEEVGGSARAQREACARAIFGGDAARTQRLYDLYAREVDRAAQDAQAQGWHGEARGQRAFMGLNGLVAFETNGVVRSAYLPRYKMDREDTGAGHDTPELRREAKVTNPMRKESDAGTEMMRLYDDVFAPCWRAVSAWRVTRPYGSGGGQFDKNTATRDALASTLHARWRGKTPGESWWRKTYEGARAARGE
jgi:hypothetical protein